MTHCRQNKNQLIDQSLDPSAVLWRNLCLLGLQSSEIWSSAMARTSLEIGPDMFKRGSNYKAQNLIFYFLFHRLDSVHALKNFAGIWPILDQRQDQEFRAITFKSLLELEKNGDIPRGTVQRSYLNCGFGTRLINLTWRFSEFVLSKAFSREFPDAYKNCVLDFPDSSKMQLPLLTAHVEALEDRVFFECKQLLYYIQAISRQNAQCQNKIDSLTDSYRKAVKSLTQWKEKERIFNESLERPDAFSELANVERKTRHAQFGCLWEKLNQLDSCSKSFYQIVESVLMEKIYLNDTITRYNISKNDKKTPAHKGTSAHKDLNLHEVLDTFAGFLPKLMSTNFINSDLMLSEIDCHKENVVGCTVGSQYFELQHLTKLLPKLSSAIVSVRSSMTELNRKLQNHQETSSQGTSTNSSPEINRIGLVPPTPLATKPVLPIFTKTPIPRSGKEFRPGVQPEHAVRKIMFSSKKHDRSSVKCPLPMASPAPHRSR